jgi:TP901 family phage tail tape measure protein
MSTQGEAKIIFSGDESKLIQALRRSESAIKTYGKNAVTVFKRVNDSLVSSYNRLGALAPLGIGVGFVALAKNVIEFDASLKKVRMSGGYTKEEISALRTEILGLTQSIPVSKDQFAEMAKELNATGIPLAVIRDILPDVGKGAKAAGADTAIYAATVGELLDKYKVAATDLPALQDQINTALKFEDVRKSPEQFLQSLQGLSKTMQLMKSGGIGNVTPLMALMAQLTSFTGSSGEAAGSLEAVFNGLLKIAKNKELNNQLKSRGIEFFDAKGGVKNINELLPMIKKFGEELKKSGKSAEEGAMAVFGRPEAAKSIMIIMEKYDEVIKKQQQLAASSGNMGKDYKDAEEGMSAKLQRFQNQIDNFNVTHMSTALDKVKTVLDFLNAHPIVSKGLMTAILGVGGLVMINKVIDAVKGVGGLFKGGGGKGAGGIAGGIGGMGGPMPVYVVNKHLSMLPGKGWGFPGGGEVPGLPGGSGSGKLISLLGKAGLIGTVAATAYGAGTLANQGAGWISGKVSGGQYGGEGWMGSLIYDLIHGKEGSKSSTNVTVNIDKNDRVTTDSDNPVSDIKVNRGRLNIGD